MSTETSGHYLTDEQLEELKRLMKEQYDKLVNAAKQSRSAQMSAEGEVPADTIDVSTGESMQVTEFRLRDREKYLIGKIEKAFRLMTTGDYGYCKTCDADIGWPRLRARPVAELCIDCKEDQEKGERNQYKRRMPEDKARFM